MILGPREKTILRILSDDGRASLTQIAKRIGFSYVTAGKILDRLGMELDIRFTVEIDPAKLGLLEKHVIAIKFRKKPEARWLRETFSRDSNVHLAYVADGRFDLLVFAAAADPVQYVLWETLLIEKLSEYGVSFRASSIPYLSFGYIPFNSEFIDNAKIKIGVLDRKLLRALNENCRASYSELARNLGTAESTVRYRIFRLQKSGIIKRFTIAIQKPPRDYVLAFFESWQFTKEFEKRAVYDRNHMMEIDKGLFALNTFQMSAPLTGSYQNIIIALFDSADEANRDALQKHRKIYQGEGLQISYARLTEPVKGIFPFRNLDMNENYNVVKWE